MTATTDTPLSSEPFDAERPEQPGESVWSAEELHGLADVLAGLDPAELPVSMLDQLDALERIKSAAAAAQVAITASLIESAEAEEDTSADVRRRPARVMSIGAEVGLAVRTSPYQGEQRVLLSRRLRDDLPGVHAALARGEIGEDQAFTLAREVAHLDPTQRLLVDADLTGPDARVGGAGLAGLGQERLRQAVRRSCLTIAADAEARRYRRARADRHVTSRLLDDGTGKLTAILKAEDLAAVRAVLDEQAAKARAAGDDRTAGQVRADTLVRRIAGQGSVDLVTAAAGAVEAADATDPAEPRTSTAPVRVNLVISAESLLGDDPAPGLIPGLGWLPSAICRDLIRAATAAAKASLRRLFVRPEDGALVAMESRSRLFPPALAEFLDLRDGGLCRTQGCNGRVRHHDHVVSDADGGATTADNGQGLCERCNYVKETPGWISWSATSGDIDQQPDHQPDQQPGRHEVHGVTEHLRLARSTAPPMPGQWPPQPPARQPGSPHLDHSPAERKLAELLRLAA